MMDVQNKEFTDKDREFLQKIDKRLGRIERRFAWSAFFSFLNALIIIGPIVIGIIYLSPIVKEYAGGFGPLIKSLPSINIKDKNVNTPDFLSPEIRAMVCNQQVRDAFIKKNCPSK